MTIEKLDPRAVDPNASVSFDTEAQFVAAKIPSYVSSIITRGYYVAGDGGGHLKTKLSSTPSPVQPWHKQSTDGAWWVISDPNVNISHLGAKNDGTTDASSIITTFASWKNYVRFGTGNYLVNTMAIKVPLYFDTESSITASAGNTITISNRINAPKQWIFKGEGSYLMVIDGTGNTGEDSRHLHASWLGVFPQNNNSVIDQTSIIQKLMNCFSGASTREGVIDFDNGAYRISAPIDVYRGTWVRGAGTRRTTFDLVGNFTAAFRTVSDACRFTGFQFETPSESGAVVFDGIQIQINNLDCTVEDISFWSPRIGLQVNGDRCDVKTIRCSNGANVSTLADSALIEINASYCRVRDVRVVGTTYGHASMISIGKNQTANIIGSDISGLETTEDSIGVLITPINNFNVYGTRINGIIQILDAGATASMVRINNSGTSSVRQTIISDLVNNGQGPDVLRINNIGAGSVSDIVLSTVNTGTVSGIILNATSGSINDITVADSADLSDCTSPLTVTGTTSQIRMPGWLSGFRGDTLVTVADDAVVSLTPPRDGGIITITAYGSNGGTPNTNGAGIASYRMLATSSVTKLSSNTNFAVFSTDLTDGTTDGTDGATCLGVTTTALRLKNRLGSTQIFRITYLG